MSTRKDNGLSDHHEHADDVEKQQPTIHNPGAAGNNLEGAPLQRQPTIALTPEQYERLFFQPSGLGAKHALSRRFGNPTPLAIISHILVISPTAWQLLGVNSANATSLVTMVGPYWFIGGLGLFVSGLLEWILGNTFPFVVFCTFGGFWFSLGVLQDPAIGTTSAFANGAASINYNTGITFYFSFWAVLCVLYFVVSLRTNIVFAEIFFTLIWTFIFLAVGFDRIGHGNVSLGTTYLKVAGGFAFGCAVGGWYLALILLFNAVEMPFCPPIGDLSTRFLTKKRKNC